MRLVRQRRLKSEPGLGLIFKSSARRVRKESDRVMKYSCLNSHSSLVVRKTHVNFPKQARCSLGESIHDRYQAE